METLTATLEGNKLIAQFMGGIYESDKFKIDKGFIWLPYHNMTQIQNLKYSTSWDWLMPVVIKIVSNDFREQCKIKGFDNWLETDLMDNILENRWDLDKLYKAVVEFIKWHNLQAN